MVYPKTSQTWPRRVVARFWISRLCQVCQVHGVSSQVAGCVLFKPQLETSGDMFFRYWRINWAALWPLWPCYHPLITFEAERLGRAWHWPWTCSWFLTFSAPKVGIMIKYSSHLFPIVPIWSKLNMFLDVFGTCQTLRANRFSAETDCLGCFLVEVEAGLSRLSSYWIGQRGCRIQVGYKAQIHLGISWPPQQSVECPAQHSRFSPGKASGKSTKSSWSALSEASPLARQRLGTLR